MTAPNTTPTLDVAALDRLDALAQAATQGPWEAACTNAKHGCEWYVNDASLGGIWDDTGTASEADAVYIAAASPDVIRALVSALRAAQADAAEQTAATSWTPDRVLALHNELVRFTHRPEHAGDYDAFARASHCLCAEFSRMSKAVQQAATETYDASAIPCRKCGSDAHSTGYHNFRIDICPRCGKTAWLGCVCTATDAARATPTAEPTP